MELKIQLNGAKIVKETIQKIIDEWEFKENVSEEYKNGFYNFGYAVINMLSKFDSEGSGEE